MFALRVGKSFLTVSLDHFQRSNSGFRKMVYDNNQEVALLVTSSFRILAMVNADSICSIAELLDCCCTEPLEQICKQYILLYVALLLSNKFMQSIPYQQTTCKQNYRLVFHYSENLY